MTLTTVFFTDAAEVCIFDPVFLKHRLSDDADWWTVPSEALGEMNDANVMFVDVGSDGTYALSIEITETPAPDDDHVSSIVKCESGRLFIGPGEETTTDDCEPTDKYGGLFAELKPAVYLVQMKRRQNQIEVVISPTAAPAENFHDRLLKLLE